MEKQDGNIIVKYKKKTRKLPKRYIPSGLSKNDRKKQIKSIFEGTKRPKISYKSKKSSWTKKFDSVYGDEIKKLPGGRRYIRDINAKNKMIRAGAERNAINAPIQGTAADMIKIAMININNFLNSNNFQTKMLLQVHDELVFDLFPSEKDILIPKIEELMQNAINLDVPITVQSGVGNNWLEAH